MRILEGRGFILKYNLDTPYKGWMAASQLDAFAPTHAAPGAAIQVLAELVQSFPGGFSLLWDLPLPSAPLTETGALFWRALCHMPGLALHVRDPIAAEFLENPIPGWFHDPRPPEGPMGHAWRQGWIGWVPESTGGGWSLPGIGRTDEAAVPQDRVPAGGQWGEVILSLGSLKELEAGDLLPLLGDTQAGIERNLSLRLNARAWPSVLPFQRRLTGWRLAVLGGREYLSANGNWEEAAARLRNLAVELALGLKCAVQPGISDDAEAAALLGHQAMREGHPWRHSLPIPPASPTFTPGLGSDPREATPLESRMTYPESMAAVLSHPPIARLRVPHVPQESAISSFLRGMSRIPAIQWIPPEVPPPGPYMQERPWAPSSAYAPLADVTQALQPRLFEDLDAGGSGPG